MLKINTEKNINLSFVFIIVVIVMYILGRINMEKFNELFVINELSFAHVFPWRWFTYCFNFNDSPFFFVFTVLILFIFAVNLERIWGSFYFGLFMLTTIMCKSIGAYLFGANLPIVDRMTLYISLMIAFGYNFPDEKVYLFFVLPIRIKVLSIIALVIMGISLLNSFSLPFMLMFLQKHMAQLPRECITLLEEYNYIKANFFHSGLLPVSADFAPFLVKAFSYLNLIIFYPKVFGISNNRSIVLKKINLIISKRNELLRKMQEEAIKNENESLLKGQNTETIETQNNNTKLCDISDFNKNDNYCLYCVNFRVCLKRSGENYDESKDILANPNPVKLNSLDDILAKIVNENPQNLKDQNNLEKNTASLCDEVDFEKEDEYCKKCANYEKCVERSNK